MSADESEYGYSYRRESTLDTKERADLRLATAGGTTSIGPAAHPYFFDGFVEHADMVAAALLVIAQIARTRFYTPPGMLAAILRSADPIVTSNGDRLRFESLSACCGVYGRLDLLPEGLDRAPRDTGTTNVDFNPPIRQALAAIDRHDPMLLAVGDDEVRITTTQTSVVERRVPLPRRWVKGLAEVQAVASTMTSRIDLAPVEMRRFLQTVPRGRQRGVIYAVPAGSGLRLATRPTLHAVNVAGLARLRVVEPLLRHVSHVRAYGPDPGPAPTAGAWQFNLAGARITIVLSPLESRGFSGEGGVLDDLAVETTGGDADLLAAVLAYEPVLDVAHLARESALPEERVRRAVTQLATAGRVGYDLADGSYFHRELPYHPATLLAEHPRLSAARELVAEGLVTVHSDSSEVHSRDTVHIVRHTRDGDRCTCVWFATHGTGRGACKHILAARLSRSNAATRTPSAKGGSLPQML